MCLEKCLKITKNDTIDINRRSTGTVGQKIKQNTPIYFSTNYRTEIKQVLIIY